MIWAFLIHIQKSCVLSNRTPPFIHSPTKHKLELLLERLPLVTLPECVVAPGPTFGTSFAGSLIGCCPCWPSSSHVWGGRMTSCVSPFAALLDSPFDSLFDSSFDSLFEFPFDSFFDSSFDSLMTWFFGRFFSIPREDWKHKLGLAFELFTGTRMILGVSPCSVVAIRAVGELEAFIVEWRVWVSALILEIMSAKDTLSPRCLGGFCWQEAGVLGGHRSPFRSGVTGPPPSLRDIFNISNLSLNIASSTTPSALFPTEMGCVFCCKLGASLILLKIS